MTVVYLSLGSNIGNREAYLRKAISALKTLPQTQVTQVSSFYETAAWGKTDQDDFLNLACQLETELDAQALLSHCQKIEIDLNRVRHEHWGPRTIDIDILLYGQEVIATENLKVPHPYMTERGFVLVPLQEISPQLTLPNGRAVIDYLNQLDVADVKVAKPFD